MFHYRNKGLSKILATAFLYIWISSEHGWGVLCNPSFSLEPVSSPFQITSARRSFLWSLSNSTLIIPSRLNLRTFSKKEHSSYQNFGYIHLKKYRLREWLFFMFLYIHIEFPPPFRSPQNFLNDKELTPLKLVKQHHDNFFTTVSNNIF